MGDKAKVVELLDQGRSQTSIAKQFGVSQAQVHRISKRKADIQAVCEDGGHF